MELLICWFVFWSSFWFFGYLFTFLDYCYGMTDMDNLGNVVKTATLNMVYTLLFIVLFLSRIPSIPYFVINKGLLVEYILKPFGCIIFTDFWFHHTHWLIHNKYLYNYVHKKHHEYIEPFALTALYCTGIEAIFCNTMAVSLFPVLFNMNIKLTYLWYIVVAINTTWTHSNLCSDKTHLVHHEIWNKNYGTIGIFDHLYGTYLAC